MEFNKEDQIFILEAKKDLNSFQIAKILKVEKTDIDYFIKSIKIIPSKNLLPKEDKKDKKI